MTEQPSRLASVGEAPVARQQLEAALFEIKRVIVGQEGMLERVLVALLSGGHLLLEGVPGLAKTRTIATLAQVLGGSFQRIQFTPDLVPSDLVGTRIWRPDQGGFATELGPVFCNFLLADEINRAPAKVQSALLEVMQEHQVTIGKTSHRVPEPFLVLATQNPIESDGTYPLPEAQVDRFMMKVLVGYPSSTEEFVIVERYLEIQLARHADRLAWLADEVPAARRRARGPGPHDRALRPARPRSPPRAHDRLTHPSRHLHAIFTGGTVPLDAASYVERGADRFGAALEEVRVQPLEALAGREFFGEVTIDIGDDEKIKLKFEEEPAAVA